MYKRIVASLLLATALCGPAEAKKSNRIAYATILPVLATAAVGCLVSGIALRYAAPNADNLAAYKRETSASDTLIPVGAILTPMSLLFAVMGGLLFDFRANDSAPAVSLAPSSAGFNVSFGGRF